MRFALALPLFVLAAVMPSRAADYVISPENTRLGFTAEIAGTIPVEGRFLAFEGTAAIDAEAPETGRLDVAIEASSAEAGDRSLTATLTGPGFFDAEHHPEMHFVSSAMRPESPGRLTIDGTLTLRGVSLPLSLDTLYRRSTGPDGRTVTHVEAAGMISRRAYGLTAFGRLVDDSVEIRIEALLLPRRP